MEITIGMEIFIISNKMCCNKITGSFFSNMHAQFSRLEAFSLINAKLGCPSFALSSALYFPIYLVPPIIKIVLFRATKATNPTKPYWQALELHHVDSARLYGPFGWRGEGRGVEESRVV